MNQHHNQAASSIPGTTQPVGPARLWLIASLGGVLLWLSQPPAALAPIAWIALVPWAMLVAWPNPLARRQYIAIWLVGSAYWLITLQGIRLAHPAIYPAWLALALFLGLYILLFVGLARVVHHRWHWPLYWAVPVIWSGLELVRSYALTGLSATLLGHSQIDWLWVVQIGDIGGTYWVSFIVAMVSAWLASVLAAFLRWGQPADKPRAQAGNLANVPKLGTAIVCGVLLMTCGYGYWRTADNDQRAAQSPILNTLLIQRNEPLMYAMSPAREMEVFQNYVDTTIAAMSKSKDVDLIIWPESMFTGGLPYRIIEEPFIVPPNEDFTAAEFSEIIAQQQDSFVNRNRWFQGMLANVSATKPPPLLVGSAVYRYAERPRAFGAALLIDQDSKVVDWYAKMHLVMFGEYIPFADWFPWLYEIGPMSQGALPGEAPVAMSIQGATVAPSICFEAMVEHVTGDGLRTLAAQGTPADLIVNLTNDAWFDGTAVLDHHRRCAQMVALINRRPLLMVGNAGPTVWINGSGQVVRALSHQTNDSMLAQPKPDNRSSLYARWGDKLSWPFAAVCLLAATFGWRDRRRATRLRSELDKVHSPN